MSETRIVTRFPPEPNGYLHLGHLKAMLFDFDLHAGEGGTCILRMDDTNPKTEKQEYVDAIVEDVKWMGFRFSRLTYTSDYFDALYDCAVRLVRMGCAYVDLTPADEIRRMRHDGIESEFRSRGAEWHLTEFARMKTGEYAENEAVLRLKINMQDDNHSLRDPIAYRVMDCAHYRTGTKYRAFPTYDFSHGIVDALEGITHSYCTTEFLVRRPQYLWPVEKLGLTPATVVEFGRLNVEGVELSKRKIIPLVADGTLSGFDDPRLYTLRGLRRRGFTPEILRSIVAPSTMARHETCLSRGWIEHELRTVLERDSPRAFAVMDPLPVVITNFGVGSGRECPHPNHPTAKDKGSHVTHLTERIWIERADFREVDSADYYRLAPHKVVRLRFSDFVRCDGYDDGSLTVSLCTPEKPKKVKGVIHWVGTGDASVPTTFEVYGDGVAGTVSRFAGYVERFVAEELERAPGTIFQFERLGYFKLDRRDPDGRPVFLRVIDLVDHYTKPVQ